MKLLKNITPVLALTLISIMAEAQQAPMYTHYMYNSLVINPGYAGSRDALTVTGLYRTQWTGFSGSPVTQTLTMHTPLPNERIGVGLSVMNDKLGPINNTSVFGNFAYRIQLNGKSKLALGISGGANISQASLSSLETDQQNDPILQNNVNKHVTPNVGLGMYYSRERFYAGISTPSILQNNTSSINQSNGTSTIGKQRRSYFLIAGAMLRISDNLAFKPTTLVKVTASAPLEIDLTGSFVIQNKLLLGAMFRSGDAVGALVGLDATPQLHVGYSYDWSYGLETFKYNNGSHEIIVRYDFLSFGKKQIHSPRYF